MAKKENTLAVAPALLTVRVLIAGSDEPVKGLFIAFKLAAAHAILAAMVAEFLMGTTGLGYLFAKTKSDFQTEQAFGASLVATVISATAFLAAGWVEKKVRERYS